MNYEGIEYVVRASLGHNQWIVLIYYPDNADGNATTFNFDGSKHEQEHQRDAASVNGCSDSG
jgi:hypothetical protein